jgi:antitoxin component of RelBE/YafQ-DinJ toxin-antitoxin module
MSTNKNNNQGGENMKDENKLENTKVITIRIKDELRINARIRALKEGKTLSEVVRELLEKYAKYEI